MHRNIKENWSEISSRTIKLAKWRWAGHTTRRNDNRWTTRIRNWQPRTGKRKNRQTEKKMER